MLVSAVLVPGTYSKHHSELVLLCTPSHTLWSVDVDEVVERLTQRPASPFDVECYLLHPSLQPFTHHLFLTSLQPLLLIHLLSAVVAGA